MKTITWLRIEGAAVFAFALIVCILSGDANWWYVLIFLVPDLSFAAYAFGPKIGAWAYNILHSYVTPIAFYFLQFVLFDPVRETSIIDFMFPSLIWLWIAHIGFDRMLGYGLKETTSFQDTHLGRIGKN